MTIAEKWNQLLSEKDSIAVMADIESQSTPYVDEQGEFRIFEDGSVLAMEFDGTWTADEWAQCMKANEELNETNHA